MTLASSLLRERVVTPASSLSVSTAWRSWTTKEPVVSERAQPPLPEEAGACGGRHEGSWRDDVANPSRPVDLDALLRRLLDPAANAPRTSVSAAWRPSWGRKNCIVAALS